MFYTKHKSMNVPHYGKLNNLRASRFILELARLIQGVFDKEITISFAPERKGEIKRSYSDITKAKEILGFSPQISLKDGVESVYKWFIDKDADQIKRAAALSGSE